MTGVERYSPTDRPLDAPLHISSRIEPLEGMENDRMVRDYQIAPRLLRLVQHLLGHIDGQQRLMHFVLGPSHDKTGIVVRFLQTERSISFDHFGNISDFHNPTTLFEKAIIFSTYHIRRSLVRGLCSRP